MSTPRSKAMAAVHGIAQPALEKLSARIAVSEPARRTLVEHFGGDPVLIPNGVALARFARAQPMPGWPGDGGSVGFLGRFDEPRKGFDVLVAAMERMVADRPGLRLLVAGPGDTEAALAAMPPAVAERVTMLGLVSEAEKERVLRSVDLYVAPNTGGESFGIILTEAMSAGTPVVASDLDAFRRVLEDGTCGALFPVGDADALAVTLADLLDDPARRAVLSGEAARAVARYDWSQVAADVVAVYETITAGTSGVAEDTRTQRLARLVGLSNG
jgi:phosphatidylinositol alpha-mannosyltransferase